jgi:hypothetical protein
MLLALAGFALLLGCGSGPTVTEIPLPTVSVSPTTGSVQTGASVQFTATVVTTISTTITWAVNGIEGGNSTYGTVTGFTTTDQSGTIQVTATYTAPASVPNPATVTVKAISSAETNPASSALLTITPATTNATVTVAPTNSVAALGSSIQFLAAVTGEDNAAVTWAVNGTAGGSSTVGTISSTGLYQAPASMPSPATVVLTATSQADPTQSASTVLMLTSTNSAPLLVNFGLNGNSGNTATNHYNGLFTTVSVCLPSTPQCQIVPNVLVDTGSVGLRLLNSALTVVPENAFGVVSDSAGNRVQECVQFPDTSYTWGPVVIADVVIAGERASSVPIQVLGNTTFPVPDATCLSLGSGPNLNSVAALGANGILGVGTSIQDCGPNCAAGQSFPAYPYYVCPLNVCRVAPVPVAQQVANPVAFFSQDSNGVLISLPSIPATGAPSLPYINPDGSGLIPAGQLIFGVGTESNNGLGSATLYSLEPSGNFAQVTYNGNTFLLGGSVDSGAKGLYLDNASALAVSGCTDNPYYCPVSTTPVTLGILGANGASGTVSLNIANADDLFTTNSTFSAFNDLALPSLNGSGTNLFNLGLPFFFGRNVFVGIAGTAVPNNASAPNGYFAF